METLIVIRGYNTWVWGNGKLATMIKDFSKRAKRYGGKFDDKCSVVVLQGTKEHIDDVTIDDMGGLARHEDVKFIKIQ